MTPGDPADKAGIRSGDIITKLNGQKVASGADRQVPGLRLAGLIAHLAPYDTVSVEFRRGEMRKTVSAVTAPRVMGFTISFDDSSKNLIALINSPLADLELASLNPELGQYFGATEGVLVISSPPAAKLGFKGGDVILAVNGRKLSDPNRLMGMLRTARTGRSSSRYCVTISVSRLRSLPTPPGSSLVASRTAEHMCARSQSGLRPPRYIFGPPWRALWVSCGP